MSRLQRDQLHVLGIFWLVWSVTVEPAWQNLSQLKFTRLLRQVMSWQFCLPLCPTIMIVSFRQKRHTFWCTSGAEWSPLLRPSPRSCVRHRRPAPATPATAREATSTASTTARTRWTLIDERLLLLQHCVCELRRKPKVMADGICRFEEKPLPSLSLLGSAVSTLAAHLVGLSGGLSPSLELGWETRCDRAKLQR